MNDATQDNAQGAETGARGELRLRVLRALEANPELSQRQLAAELGVSLGGVNYALKALMERGFVKADNFRKSGNKVAYLYVLTPRGVAEKASLTSRFLKRKMEEYDALKVEIEALKSEVDDDEVNGLGKLAR